MYKNNKYNLFSNHKHFTYSGYTHLPYQWLQHASNTVWIGVRYILQGDVHAWEDVYLSCDHQAHHAPTHNMATIQDMHTLILYETAVLWRGLATVLMDDFIPTALHMTEVSRIQLLQIMLLAKAHFGVGP